MATHDPHRVKSFVCRHTGCGRSFSRKHDLGRHYTSIHGGSTGGGNLSGEERASIRGHRAGSRAGSAYGGGSVRGQSGEAASNDDEGEGDGSSSTEGEGGPPVHNKNKSGSQSIVQERVWCDGCGRGWIQGTREACECDDKSRWQVSTVTSSAGAGGSQYRGE